MPKTKSFNEIITLDIKDFDNKYILWMIDSFTQFIQEKLLSNKKEDTIIQAITDTWYINIGFPSHGFFADDSGEFSNVKLDELTSN